MRPEPSLTREEALARADVVAVDRYDIAVDLTDLLTGSDWHATSTVTFRARPGAATYVDVLGRVHEATLNGRPLDPATTEGGRLPLDGLAERNTLVVRSTQSDTGRGAGILRTVDTDGLVYVWTTFEADDARRAWACFDQPDLKAPHAFTVTAPESWSVCSNSAPDRVGDAADGARVWTFPDTPPLSTYVVVVDAGPFHEVREHRGGYSLGLWCRQSLAGFLERDAEELLELTEQGLAFFGERFGTPFGQERYDHVFVPNMGGAMENWGCVTWSDSALHRSDPTTAQREATADTLLHEMAHMWFGDLVTMRWWDDLWLNEAFASWASTWALENATRYGDAWATFLATLKLEGYRMDLGPASHPIHGDVPTVAHAMANFDAISYLKGQSVLKQLSAYVGEDAFVAGLRDYFSRHAWGNTTLEDFLAAIGSAAGRDLSGWGRRWLQEAGTDTLRVEPGRLVAQGPGGAGEPRPHHLRLGVYADRDGSLSRVASVPVETAGAETPLPDLPAGDLVLPNDDDLTFASVRPDPGSLRVLLDRAGDLPDPMSRALAVTTGWDMMVRGELSGADHLRLVVGVLRTERAASLVEPHLRLALRTATQWVPPADVDGHLAVLAALCAELADEPEHRLPALRVLAACATTDEHFAVLDGPRGAGGAGNVDDVDLAWRVLARRAELGDHDADAVGRLAARDPDPDAWVRALGVRAARPDADGKDEAFRAIFAERTVPAGRALVELGQLLWRPGQDELLRPFTRRYLTEVTSLGGGGMLALGGIVRHLFPYQNGDAELLARVREAAGREDLAPVVRSALLTGADTLGRMLRQRSSGS